MTEYITFRGRDYSVSYKPYETLMDMIEFWRRGSHVTISAVCEGHWWYLDMNLAQITMSYAIPTAVVDHIRRTRAQWSPNDVRLPSWMPEPQSA